MTNKTKLIQWDTEFYNSLSDDDCLVCLSEKQKYVLGQILEPIKWSTRWTDTDGIDIDAIGSEIESRLVDMTTCKNVGDILDIIQQLQTQIIELSIIINNIDSQTGTPTELPDVETPIGDITPTPSDIIIGGDLEIIPCTTNVEKNHLYSAVSYLVDYILASNRDFLELVEQNIGNVAENAENLIEAFPFLGSLPFDDIIEWSGWTISQLLDEYEAAITEDFIQIMKCDLFCFAVANGCKLSVLDLYDYCEGKLPSSMPTMTALTMADAISFALLGNFVSDHYIYWLCIWQFTIRALGQSWFGKQGWKQYDLRWSAGKDDTNDDWQVFCVECPPYFRYYVQDFQNDGLGDWTIYRGELTGQGVSGIFDEDNEFDLLVRFVPPAGNTLIGAKMTYSAEGRIGDGVKDFQTIRGFTSADFTIPQVFFAGGGFGTDGSNKLVCDDTESDLIGSIQLGCGTANQANMGECHVHKIEFWFTPTSNLGKLMVEEDIC